MKINMTKHRYNKKLDIPQDADSVRYFIPEGYTARLEDDVLIIEPEESEDERMATRLIHLIHTGGYLEEPIRTQILAWLEKQKEQIGEDLSTRLNGVMQEYVKAGKDEEEQEHRLKCYQLFWDALGDSEFFKQEEQKPEWSDTDNIGWDEAFACVTRAEKAAKNEEELQNAVIAEKWLKEIKFKYYVHPVKQEWSKEDIKIIDMICSNLEYLIKEAGYDSKFKDKLEERIKWMKRLKSLNPQPHWKPSEEQMDALEKILHRCPETLDTDKAKMLWRLFEQLKKLM